MYLETVQTVRRKVWQWLKDQILQDVPEVDGLCEYDCRKQQCTKEEWATCERRIHRAAGELWPESSAASRGEETRSARTSQTAPQSPEAEWARYRATPLSRCTTSNQASVSADDTIDAALHNEVKCRAYELYQREREDIDGHDLRDKLGAELHRVAYAVSQIQKHSNDKRDDSRAVRAARVYLRALSSFISNREPGSRNQSSEPRMK